jgi:DNA invertase Pin-like site-specific DNA recombinase
MTSKANATPPQDVCVVYCRVSSDRQAQEGKTSLDDQERRGCEMAARLKLSILYVARHAESAWVLDKRSQFQDILADARAGKFGVLIVDRMNRFSRSEDLSEPMLVLHQLRDLGIRVEFCDRQYTQDVVGQMMMLFELGMSARDQEQRRKASRAGKVGRVIKNHHPIPTRRPLYGYVWKPTRDGEMKKTELLKDPGSAQDIADRIWHYFLHYTPTHERPRPTVRAIKMILNAEHVPPPCVYHGVRDKKGKRRNIWTSATIQKMLHNGVYWGQPRSALSDSKYRAEQPPVPIPAYGPAYVTPAEAARVHAILALNAAHSGRPPKHDKGTLLHAGLVYCGYCGGRMDPMGLGAKLPDGTKRIGYRCNEQVNHGRIRCQGTSITAATLDFAVVDRLDEHLRREHFLEQLFATWEADETAAQGQVRIAQAALDDAREQLTSLVASSARHAPNTPTWAAIQLQLDQLNTLVPGLEARVEAAQAAVSKVRGNAAFRDELKLWFEAWMHGFCMLPIERQRQFLEAVHARVIVWREDEPTRAGLPRAELVIGLPTDVTALPVPYPEDLAWMNTAVEPDGWHVPLDIERAAEVNRMKESGWHMEWSPEEAVELAEGEQRWQNASADELMAALVEEMREQGLEPPKAATTLPHSSWYPGTTPAAAPASGTPSPTALGRPHLAAP